MEHYAKQDSASGFYVFADDSTALGSGKTGLTITVTLSKSGAAENSVFPTVTEIGNGWYWIAPIAAHRDTLGRNLWQFSATGSVIAGRVERIGLVDPELTSWGASVVDSSTVARGVYQRLAGASVAVLEAPAAGDALDVVHSADFSLSIPVETAADSVLVWTVRRCRDNSSADLEADSSGGLVTVLGDAAADASKATVTRVDATSVDVWVAASVVDDLRLGKHFGELREIAADGTVASRFECDLIIRRAAGRRVA